MFSRWSVDDPYNPANSLVCSTRCFQHFTPSYSPLPGLHQKQALWQAGRGSTQELPYFLLLKKIILKISKWQPEGTNHLLPLLLPFLI